jgi:secreted PhoX family phosphatase
MNRSRREFLHESFSVCSAFGIATAFSSLNGRVALGEEPKKADGLIPVMDQTTGLPLLRLPEGFRYATYGWTKDPMSDGILTPSAHDGMGVVSAEGNIVTLIRNHEVNGDGGAIESERCKPFDVKAPAGCTTLRFNTSLGEFTDSRLSLSGSSRNCAGGITPWGTWLTCEETVLQPESIDANLVRKFKKTHGWIFDVPPAGVTDPVPLEEMGRFVHEAVAIDRHTGIVYETEDRDTAGFYRFIPNVRNDLPQGGRLEMAEVVGQPDLRGGVAPGAVFEVRWHKIDDPRLADTPGICPPDSLGVFKQGKAKGGTTFARLEGCWASEESIYFAATSGGAATAGQIWRYDPSSERLTLLFESPAKETLNMPDNLCVNPAGGLILCEDNGYTADEYPQRMFILRQNGTLQLFAQNNIVLNGEYGGFSGDFRNQEWAGATFDQNGEWLFVNIQTPGLTVAITGPWADVL